MGISHGVGNLPIFFFAIVTILVFLAMSDYCHLNMSFLILKDYC